MCSFIAAEEYPYALPEIGAINGYNRPAVHRAFRRVYARYYRKDNGVPVIEPVFNGEARGVRVQNCYVLGTGIVPRRYFYFYRILVQNPGPLPVIGEHNITVGIQQYVAVLVRQVIVYVPPVQQHPGPKLVGYYLGLRNGWPEVAAPYYYPGTGSAYIRSDAENNRVAGHAGIVIPVYQRCH